MLRMIDKRRESGIAFAGSYDEEVLRIAVEPCDHLTQYLGDD